jgi:6-phosphogluconate dehydrogenase
MGQNLILNAADHGFEVVAFNRTVSKVDHFLANEAKGKFFYYLGYDFQSMLTGINRQINRWCTLDRGVRLKTQETPPHDALGHGW